MITIFPLKYRYDTPNNKLLERLTKIKVSALTVIEAMLELSNEEAKQIALSVKSTINLEELYLAMNRFYYIALFRCVRACGKV